MDCIYFKNWIFSEGLDEGEREKNHNSRKLFPKDCRVPWRLLMKGYGL